MHTYIYRDVDFLYVIYVYLYINLETYIYIDNYKMYEEKECSDLPVNGGA